MKIIWTTDKTIAIPLNNIICFEITEWSDKKYHVEACYAICTGVRKSVFESDNKKDCIKFIESLW